MAAVENIEFIFALLTRRGLGLCGRVAPPQKASAVVTQETILDACVKASSGGLACPVIVVSLNDVGNGGKREFQIDGVGIMTSSTLEVYTTKKLKEKKGMSASDFFEEKVPMEGAGIFFLAENEKTCLHKGTNLGFLGLES